MQGLLITFLWNIHVRIEKNNTASNHAVDFDNTVGHNPVYIAALSLEMGRK